MIVVYLTPGLVTPLWSHDPVLIPRTGDRVTEPSPPHRTFKVTDVHFNFPRQGIEVTIVPTLAPVPLP